MEWIGQVFRLINVRDYMNGFDALDIPPCRRYVVVKATAGFAVCRLIL